MPSTTTKRPFPVLGALLAILIPTILADDSRLQTFPTNDCTGAPAVDAALAPFACQVLAQPAGSFLAATLPDNCGWFAFSGTDCGKGEGFGSLEEGGCVTETTSGGAPAGVRSVKVKCT
jgi:hypothetical protein